MRRGFDESRGDGRVWHRAGSPARDVGLGRWTLLRLVGRRPHRGARDRLENFAAFLAGGARDRRAFPSAPLAANLPVLLALIGIWNRNFLHAPTHAVLPYDDHLARFPAYLQQLEMESNGKSVRRSGEPVECATCPVIWGEPGSNAQHSFYQLLHQGTERGLDRLSAAGAFGRRAPGAARSRGRELPRAGLGARRRRSERAAGVGAQSPSALPRQPAELSAAVRASRSATLGKLVALYEHKVYVQGVIWDMNSFDQWGVQLGKKLASQLRAVGERRRRSPRRSRVAGALRALASVRERELARGSLPVSLSLPTGADIMRPSGEASRCRHERVLVLAPQR